MERGKRKKLWLAFAILFAALAFASIGTASASTIYVPDDYAKIQWAVDAASSGDTIIVRDGTYTENVDVNKRLTIRSENGSASTIVQAADPDDHVFNVTSNYVNISGFMVCNATGSAGLYLGSGIEHCNISNNYASNNYFGIYLLSSGNNTLTDNTMFGNKYNFGVWGWDLSDFIQNIDTSNLVDGKPIYYWVNQQNRQIPDDAGYVGIVNSTNITVRDLTLTNNSEGVLFAYTNNSRIKNVTASNNRYGIYLHSSSNNTLTNNTANSNNYYGIYLRKSSSNNTLTNNTANSNNHYGIYLYSSSNNNTLTNNTANSNNEGIYLVSSSNNTLTNNTANSNNWYGLYLYSSSNNNTLMNNTANSNNYGIYLTSSDNNTIYNNYFNNTNNAWDNGVNTWNITLTSGTNIIGGPYHGGNYWSDYIGKDTDGDELGDTNRPYNSSGNIQQGGDWHPLVVRVSLPDLGITEKWVCWPDNCTICYNVTNIGNGTAPACHNTTLFVDGFEVAHDHVPVPLAPGENHTGCFKEYVWTYTPPSDNITVCADNNNTIDESNETNNCLTNIWMCGDVNEDHTVNVVDVLHVYKRALDPGYPLDLPWAGDVNCDRNINVVDVLHVYRRALDPGYDLNCCCTVLPG